MKTSKINIAVLASGTGTNTRVILEHFKQHAIVTVAVVITNKPQAGVIQVAESYGVPVEILPKKEDYEADNLHPILEQLNVQWFILSGFLLKIPDSLVGKYRDRIINIHPSLLPKFGGKGMYGMHVHQAVKDAGESKSGITIHLVDEIFDNGEHLFQASCEVTATDTPEDIQKKVQVLEHKHFPEIIEKTVLNG